MVDAGENGFRRISKTLCPSGLRGWTQVPLAQAAWVQIPQVSLFGSRHLKGIVDAPSPAQHPFVFSIPLATEKGCANAITK